MRLRGRNSSDSKFFRLISFFKCIGHVPAGDRFSPPTSRIDLCQLLSVNHQNFWNAEIHEDICDGGRILGPRRIKIGPDQHALSTDKISPIRLKSAVRSAGRCNNYRRWKYSLGGIGTFLAFDHYHRGTGAFSQFRQPVKRARSSLMFERIKFSAIDIPRPRDR